MFNKITGITWLGAGFFSLSLAWCSTVTAANDLPVLDLDRPFRWDFSGSWEKDFLRSDDWTTELKRMITLQQEALERQQRRAEENRRFNRRSTLPVSNVRQGRGVNLVDLARLAKYISRQSTLQIIQTGKEVRIQREGEADLVCGLSNGTITTFSSPHGSEVCGWNRQQLMFQITLPENLVIMHRFNVSADAKSLRMITSVSSKGSDPFNLVNAYDRYEAPPDEFNCVQTLSRGKVCSQAELPE